MGAAWHKSTATILAIDQSIIALRLATARSKKKKSNSKGKCQTQREDEGRKETLFAAESGRREVAGQPPRNHADLVSHAKLKITDTNRETDYHPPDLPQPSNNLRQRPRDYRGNGEPMQNTKLRWRTDGLRS